jgi:hypothetical protein
LTLSYPDVAKFLNDQIENNWSQRIANRSRTSEQRRHAILAWVWVRIFSSLLGTT